MILGRSKCILCSWDSPRPNFSQISPEFQSRELVPKGVNGDVRRVLSGNLGALMASCRVVGALAPPRILIYPPAMPPQAYQVCGGGWKCSGPQDQLRMHWVHLWGV